jgi:hypothetical protein
VVEIAGSNPAAPTIFMKRYIISIIIAFIINLPLTAMAEQEISLPASLEDKNPFL